MRENEAELRKSVEMSTLACYYVSKDKRQLVEWTLDRVKRLRKLHQITGWWRQMTKKIKQAAHCVADNGYEDARAQCTGCCCLAESKELVSWHKTYGKKTGV